MRRATNFTGFHGKVIIISIHALLAESDVREERLRANLSQISIHALLAESDSPAPGTSCTQHRFLSTLSLRRATLEPVRVSIPPGFLSTLSLRRATARRILTLEPDVHFYPRSPCGERLGVHHTTIYRELFLSTLSLRRATFLPQTRFDSLPHFYPRSPCGERRAARGARRFPRDFYPRSPCGERRCRSRGCWPRSRFLSTLSLRRATSTFGHWEMDSVISIHALLAESDCCPLSYRVSSSIFLSTLSLRRATAQG